ncbi:hypothetical protein OG255_45665 (plasmid) [Streptomyces sp. NBC_01455]|nr:hypothetical protein [Streptomyces sp. NBC_01455]
MIKVLRPPVEFALRPVVGVHDRSGQAPAGSPGGREGVDDEVGAHVIGDRPPGQAA